MCHHLHHVSSTLILTIELELNAKSVIMPGDSSQRKGFRTVNGHEIDEN